MNNIIIIYGPTGSGKTQLSIELASENRCSIINADSTQIYDRIKILNASPTEEEKKSITHHLFNHFSIYQNYSLGLYINDIEPLIQMQNQNSIIVGGTGMYINTLINGVRTIPDIEKNIRESIREKFIELGIEKFYQELLEMDKKIDGKIHPNNSHRLIRAYEVIAATGQSIYDFRDDSNTKSLLSTHKITKIYLKPDRDFLYKLCDARFDNMIKNGAIEEVESIKLFYPEISPSVKKIIGLEEIYSYINNLQTIDDVKNIAKQRTRNYAKRQYTWFNNQMKSDIIIDFASLSQYEKQIKNLRKIL